jgi:hypothetical protein
MLDYCTLPNENPDAKEWHESAPSWAKLHRDETGTLKRAERAFAAALSAARAPITTFSIADRFREHSETWQRETMHMSSPTQRMEHPSYQAILGLARDNKDEVVRLLIRDMTEHGREWFWALSYLTGENPINRKDAGNLDKMIASWHRWAKERKLA